MTLKESDRSSVDILANRHLNVDGLGSVSDRWIAEHRVGMLATF